MLYNLPRLVTSNVSFIFEGEKDADRVTGLGLYQERGEWRIACTTTYDGAWKPGENPKWLESYSPYFAGKFVVIFPDNDEPGEAYATCAG